MGRYQGGQRSGPSGWARGWRPRGQGSAATAKTVVQWSDLVVEGCYTVPASSAWYGFAGVNTGYPKGLAVRWVGGESYPRLYITFQSATSSNIHNTVEYQPTTAPGTVASPASLTPTAWVGNLMETLQPSGLTWVTAGLHWDETGQRLYWGAWRNYGTEQMPSWGVSTLGGAPTEATPVGIWRPYTNVQWHQGMSAVPGWFADAYLGGKRFVLGYGGNRSATTDGKHFGLALYAVEPIDLTRDTTPVAGSPGYVYAGGITCLSSHVWSDTANRMLRGTWSGDWYQETPGYRMATDGFLDSGVWIDTSTKHGFLLWSSSCESAMRYTAVPGRTTVAVRAVAGATQLVLAEAVADWQYRDLWFVNSNLARPSGNGNFDVSQWVHPLYGTTGGPYGEPIAVTSVSGNVVTFERPNTSFNFAYEAGGLRADVEVGAQVIAGNTYWDATVPRSRLAPQVFGFDPMQFAEVAAGDRLPTAVTWDWAQTTSIWPDSVDRGWGGNHAFDAGIVSGACWDAVGERLYVYRRGMDPKITGRGAAKLFVYRVA